MSATVRPLELADADAAWRMLHQGNEDISRVEPHLPALESYGSIGEFRDSLVAELADPEHRHLIAERSDGCVGWGHAFVAPAPDNLRIGYVSAVYVDRAARRRGIGTQLVRELVAWLREQEPDRIELVTPSRGSGRSVWLRIGFRPFLETMLLDARENATSGVRDEDVDAE